MKYYSTVTCIGDGNLFMVNSEHSNKYSTRTLLKELEDKIKLDGNHKVVDIINIITVLNK